MAIVEKVKVNDTQKIDKVKFDNKKSEKIQEIVVRDRFIRTTPDKMSLVAHLVIGQEAEKAVDILTFSFKLAAKPLISVIKNGIDIAKNKYNLDGPIYIKSIMINEGPKLKRRRMIHRGRATAILKRSSHATIIFSNENKLLRSKRRSIPDGASLFPNRLHPRSKSSILRSQTEGLRGIQPFENKKRGKNGS
ncbi:MAG: 50S ribosomal protein L22 [Berkelbacteria bacterium GW2011_GWB1_38_5]|uniref:50S ribosomal protein L22 n=2 Tax=Candidatus Berkelbacteria TaxID=1618330 RepID=A0A0G0LIU1_9BACT|nr:MAG: 50S ribosomal protein L22 [Berkelbacteria bacterium GW2011_GWB1_38_5]KKQ90972.1 MAG: 50S ribosomal protein L22 [Berkelbacteria bacterium GW2011_GWA1_39_10]